MEQFPKIARARMAAPVTGPHPEAEQLSAFAENALDTRERESVLAHLAACRDCREVVALAAEARPAGAPVLKAARGGFRWATFQWAAVAASVAIVTVAVLVVGPKETRSPQPASETSVQHKLAAEPQVATNAPATSNDEEKSLGVRPEIGAARKSQPAMSKSAGPTVVPSQGIGSGAGIGGGVYRVQADQKTSDTLAKLEEKKEAQEPAAKTDSPRNLTYSTSASGSTDTFYSSVPVSRPAPAQIQTKVAQPPAPAAPAVDGERGRLEAQASNELSKDKRADAGATAASTESVEVTGRAVAPVAVYSRQKSKQAELKQPAGNVSGGMVAASLDAVNLRVWRLHSGSIQSSDNGGKVWQEHALPKDFHPAQIAAAGEQVWAGGKAGSLFASSDNGQTWTKVSLTGDDVIPLGDVAAIKITNPQTVDVLLSTGDDWQSSDGGKSFRLLPRKP